LLLQPFVIPLHKESNIINFLILIITIFTLTDDDVVSTIS
jgi:hypothetical protein